MAADTDASNDNAAGQDQIARLLAVPLGAFVEERKRLAAALKSLGRRDEAQAILKLAKPSAAVWVVNQLARRELALMRRLGELTAAMQTAPRRAREGGDDYARLLTEHREALRSLRGTAERILVEAKLSASSSVLERITHTLRAGMADEESRGAILEGRLLREVGELDFASLVGTSTGGDDAEAPWAAVPAPAVGNEQEQEQEQERARTREAAAKAREQEREKARARADAEREVEQLRGKAHAAHKQVAVEERAVESARRALGESEARFTKARGEAEAADRALAAAEKAARAPA